MITDFVHCQLGRIYIARSRKDRYAPVVVDRNGNFRRILRRRIKSDFNRDVIHGRLRSCYLRTVMFDPVQSMFTECE